MGTYVHIHGGGWCLGSHLAQDRRLQGLADATGLLVLSVGYRLAPEHPFPACLDDCPFGSAASSAVARVSAVLDADARRATQAWASRIAVRSGEAGRPVMAAVEQSLAPPWALRVIYVDGAEVRSERVVELVGLMAARGRWHIIARCRRREANRGFRLDRIEHARCLPDAVPERDLDAVLAAERILP